MTPPAPLRRTSTGTQPAAPAKMKVDVNTELYHIKRMLVYLLQSMGQSVPPDMLLGDPAEDPYAEPGKAQNDPASAAASPGAMESAIKPIDPMQGASPAMAQGGGQPKQAYWENGGGYGSESHARSQQAVTKLNNGVDALRALIRAQA
jgi:hypothetical protein